MLLVFLSFFLCVFSTPLNHVIILIDDLGYNDTNIGKAPFIRNNVNTPNLMQMAHEGVLFDNFYAGASICTPSRAALLSGRFPALWNFFGANRVYLSPGQTSGFLRNMTSLATYLKSCGYSTGMNGKWHLGRSKSAPEDLFWMPLNQGFDVAELVSPMGNGPSCTAGEVGVCQQTTINGQLVSYFPYCPLGINSFPCPNTPLIPWNCTYGFPVPIGGSTGPDPRRNAGYCQFYRGNTITQQPWDIANMTQRLTDEALAYFNARAADQQPFFYFFSHIGVHEPWFSNADFFGKSKMGTYGDMIEEMDWSVGQVLNRLRASDIGPTVVYFMSDNGAFLEKNAGIPNRDLQTSSGALRGGKGQHFEGGHRVPAIVWTNTQADSVLPLSRDTLTHAVGHMIDIYKTIATQQQSACPAPAQPLEGKDLTPVLTGASAISSWQTPNTYLPIFCENNLVAVRWRDGGIPNTIPPRDLKVIFATVNWTLPALQACPSPNPYTPAVCPCNFLIQLAAPNTTTDRSLWYQLFDINQNINENPAQSLLLDTNPQLVNYYLNTLIGVGAFVRTKMATYDSNPQSMTGIYDFRTTTPTPNNALLSCPGDPVTCEVNAETGATQVTITSSKNPSYFGEQIAFRATVSSVSPVTAITSGKLYFRINTPWSRTALGPMFSLTPNGVTLPTNALPANFAQNPFHSITAEYQGQPGTYLAATSIELVQYVRPATTAITISTSSPLIVGQSITLNANIQFTNGQGVLVGTLIWYNNNQQFATNSVNGVGNYQATITFLSVTSYQISVSFTPGSTNFATSQSATTLQINKATPTVTFESNPAGGVVIGQPIQYTVTVVGYFATGQVTIDDVPATLTDGVAIATITILDQVGTVPVTIAYSGDANNEQVTVTDNKEVAKAEADVQLTAEPPILLAVVGQPTTLSATVTPVAPSVSTPAGSIKFSPSNIVVPLIDGTAELATAPEHTFLTLYRAEFVPTFDVYTSSPSNTITQITLPASTKTTLTTSVNGNSRTFTATVTAQSPSTGIPYGTVSFEHGFQNQNVQLVNGVATWTVTNFRGKQLTATYAGNSDYKQSSATIKF